MRTLVIFAFVAVFSLTAAAQQKIAAQFPKATIAGKSSGTITADEIAKAGELKTTDSELKVVSFAFCVNEGKDRISIPSNSNKIPGNLVAMVRKMQSGQFLYVDDIQTVKSDGAPIKLEMLKFKIE